MPSSLEADVTYLNKMAGARQTLRPAGFAVRAAARKAARGRDQDLLFVATVLHPRTAASATRSAPLETSALETQAVDLVNVAAKTYFGVPGSVTSALRETGSAINLALLQWNLRVARQAINAQGSLTLGVLRHDELYLAQAGAAVAVVVRAAVIELFPPEPRDNRPLGISQTADLLYWHCEVAPGDFLVLGNEFWADAAFAGFNDLTLELAADRLAERVGPDAAALVARFVPSGEVQRPPEATPVTAIERLRARLTTAARWASSVRPPSAPRRPERAAGAVDKKQPCRAARESSAPSEQGGPTQPAGIVVSPSPALPAPPSPPAGSGLASAETPPVLEPFTRSLTPQPALPARRRPPRLSDDEEAPLPPSGPTSARPLRRPDSGQARSSPPRLARRGRLAALQTSLDRDIAAVGRTLNRGLSSLLRRVLPEGLWGDRDVRLPVSWMAAIAIGLPVVVGLLVASTYIQRGREQQYAEFLGQAQLEVSLARTAADTGAARTHWNAALDWLDRAEAVASFSDDVAALRLEAQDFLDTIDQTTRLTFEPLVLGGFGRGVNLTHLVANGPQVYALDPAAGRVFRAVRTEAGTYAVDENFKCASGPVGDRSVGSIVDIVWLAGPSPAGSDILMAMDTAGTLVFCPPEGSPPLAAQLTPPDTGWTGPRAIALYGEGLYVLDPPANQIWVFNRPGGKFTEGPSRFFTSPSYDLSQAIDFTIANGEVFLLFADGRVAMCNRSADGAQTTCAENEVFTDGREGHTSGLRLDDLQTPLALLYDPPPEPSLYLADTGASSVYQVSLKLVLQRQFRPAGKFDAPLAAMAIGSHKELYVAAGDNIYVGARP